MATVQYAKDQPKGFKNRIENVAIVGAGGTMGGQFARELLKTGRHKVTGLTRADSNHKLPDGVDKVIVNYEDHKGLVKALRGQDFFIITLSIHAPQEIQIKLAQAAAEAGVKYVMPNAYGYDPSNESLLNDQGFGDAGRLLLPAFKKLGLNIVVLACGFWYEFSLAGSTNRYGFDITNRKVTFFDKGDVKIHTSTWPQCGRAVAALLSLPVLPQDATDKSPNLAQYVSPNSVCISSFYVSQKDMFESVKRVTGTADADWTITYEPAKERYANAQKVLESGGGVNLDGVTPLSPVEAFGMRMYTRIFFPGGDELPEDRIANKVLNLPQEDQDEWTGVAVRMVENDDLASYGS